MHSQHEINVVQLTPYYAKSYYTVVSGSPASLLYGNTHDSLVMKVFSRNLFLFPPDSFTNDNLRITERITDFGTCEDYILGRNLSVFVTPDPPPIFNNIFSSIFKTP